MCHKQGWGHWTHHLMAFSHFASLMCWLCFSCFMDHRWLLLQVLCRKKSKHGQQAGGYPSILKAKAFPRRPVSTKQISMHLSLAQSMSWDLLASKKTGHRCLEFLVSTSVRQAREKGWEGGWISRPPACPTTSLRVCLTLFCLSRPLSSASQFRWPQMTTLALEKLPVQRPLSLFVNHGLFALDLLGILVKRILSSKPTVSDTSWRSNILQL